MYWLEFGDIGMNLFNCLKVICNGIEYKVYFLNMFMYYMSWFEVKKWFYLFDYVFFCRVIEVDNVVCSVRR